MSEKGTCFEFCRKSSVLPKMGVNGTFLCPKLPVWNFSLNLCVVFLKM